MPNIVRWLLVLPGAIICAVLATFPLHWVLYQTLTGSGIVEPYPEFPERALTPFAAAFGFVWAGGLIAPSRKVETAVVLFGLWLMFVGAGLALALTGGQIGWEFNPQYGFVGPAGAICGALLGLYIVRRQVRDGEIRSDAN